MASPGVQPGPNPFAENRGGAKDGGNHREDKGGPKEWFEHGGDGSLIARNLFLVDGC